MGNFRKKTDQGSQANGLLEGCELAEIAYRILIDGCRLLEFNRIEYAVLFDDNVDFSRIALPVTVVVKRRFFSGVCIAFQDFGKTPGFKKMSGFRPVIGLSETKRRSGSAIFRRNVVFPTCRAPVTNNAGKKSSASRKGSSRKRLTYINTSANSKYGFKITQSVYFLNQIPRFSKK